MEWTGSARNKSEGKEVSAVRSKKRNNVESIEAIKTPSSEVSTNRVQVMSAQEAMARLIAGAAATAYADEQFHRVQSVRIVGLEDHGQLEALVKEIPEDELNNLCLEMAKNPELLGDSHSPISQA
ncbi:hypothetical protein J2S70_001629 [Trueperella bonasi]|uniref:Uncharacterized protein n=1 Tax=Trueperella bonasi TaxID=312286 RepID=A0ABT9NI25_9ACTO|nr:hypothetical protein [Trueperella bonasi]MDP9807047.1 hypothetical protein [Trueperella bonasi]